MNQIVSLSAEAILFLAEAATRADAEEKRLRISIGTTGGGATWLKFKVGEGMWTPAFFDDYDPYRDGPVTVQSRLSVGPDGKPVVTD